MYPLTTTTARIDACHPCPNRRDRAAQLLGITEPSDEPISYAYLLDTLGLDDALWCCRAEPDVAPIWRRYVVWCARRVQHLMTDQRTLDALDVAERHADGQASDEELGTARAAARKAVLDALDAASNAGTDAFHAAWIVWAAAGGAAGAAAAAAGGACQQQGQQQAAAFRQLVTTGTLP